MKTVFLACLGMLINLRVGVAETFNLWPNLAPGESTRLTGEQMPFRKEESLPVTRMCKITQPTFTAHRAKQPNGTAVVILPGGGFEKVVIDKEGTEAAEWLNRCGITAFVLHYRTKVRKNDPGWKRPLQDAQRTMSLIRSQAQQWGCKENRIGLLGFSAGGQVAARLLCNRNQLAYDPVDDVDRVSHRPDFTLLIYPWNLYDQRRDALIDEVHVPHDCPPVFFVHTDDDRSSSLGSLLLYTALKRNSIPAELHIYGKGGHGYGLRDVEGSRISTWPQHAYQWLREGNFVKN